MTDLVARATAAGITGPALDTHLRHIHALNANYPIDLDTASAILRKTASSDRVTGETIAQLHDHEIPVLGWIATDHGTDLATILGAVRRGEITPTHLATALDHAGDPR